MRIDKACEDCGVLMTNVHFLRKHCYECAKKRRKEYQSQYVKEKRTTQKPQVRITNANKKYCKGCVYWGGFYEHNACCNYIFIEGHSRPCPPGKGCTEKIVGARIRTMEFGEEKW